MAKLAKADALHERRKRRVRTRISQQVVGRLRLTVHRTNQHIYAQIIENESGKTLAAASSLDKELRPTLGNGSNKDAAVAVGKLIAQRAKKAKVSQVVFDRGGYLYHGRVKALAESAREGGLEF